MDPFVSRHPPIASPPPKRPPSAHAALNRRRRYGPKHHTSLSIRLRDKIEIILAHSSETSTSRLTTVRPPETSSVRKLGARDRAQLVVIAYESGLATGL